MNTVNEIASAIQTLSPTDLKALQEWLENYLEDHLELSAETNAALARAEQEMAEGKGRLHKAGR